MSDAHRHEFRKVEPQNRVRVPLEFARQVRWINELKKGEDAVAWVAMSGKLVLYAPGTDTSPWQQAEDDEIEFDDDVPPASVPGLTTRYFGPVRLHIESDRLTIQLPRWARVLDAVPTHPNGAVVMAFGNRLEIWRTELWITSQGQKKSSGV